MKTSNISQWVLDSLIGLPPRRLGLTRQFTNMGLRWLRRVLIYVLRDPKVNYRLDGTKLVLPLSHQLPLIRAAHPYYSTNLARIAFAVFSKYPAMSMVDIGANVGDTVAIVRRLATFPILCIDGDQTFFQLLKHNAREWEQVLLAKAFVGSINGSIPAHVETTGGTGRLVVSSTSDTRTETKSLSTILREYPEFPAPRLIKIDTDGFDIRIIQSEIALLQKLRPTIFLEYDPHFFSQHQEDGFRVFADLRAIGYRAALVFENTGELLLQADLDNDSLLEDLHYFYRGRGGHRYCDIAFFHEVDLDVCALLRSAEHKSVQIQRPQSS